MVGVERWLLGARLAGGCRGKVSELHRNAAAWYAERGLADDAIRHAVAAGEMTWVARLIERHYGAIFQQGESATTQRWLAALPDELARSRPRLALAQGRPRPRRGPWLRSARVRGFFALG